MGEKIEGLDGLVGASKQISIAIGSLNQTLSTLVPPVGGISATVVLAKITGGGSDGSAAFSNGILTSYSPPT